MTVAIKVEQKVKQKNKRQQPRGRTSGLLLNGEFSELAVGEKDGEIYTEIGGNGFHSGSIHNETLEAVPQSSGGNTESGILLSMGQLQVSGANGDES
ncbi:MAG: hypothetical protein NC079_09750 [Clostridium sp.]|nr:hypothetical protein [Acetatifactor muris]MCM1527782.1 hypothetical protein [Bacteroides sp.]MCM1563877.1 hypothetical protein [Clostridium sp.]